MKTGKASQELADNLPEKIFRLKHELLIPGDIIASTVPDSRTSKLIRWHTKGEFSHVALCFMKNVLIEALGKHGVILSVPNRVFVEDKNTISIFRPKKSILNIPNFEERLAAKCFDAWLSGYALAKLGFVVFPNAPFKAGEDKYFCSELVCTAYLSCGINLSGTRKPEQSSPRDIYESVQLDRLNNDTLLEEVSKEQFHLLYLKGGFLVSDSPQKSSDMSLELEMHSSLQQLAREVPDGKSSWEFKTKQIELFSNLMDSKLKQYIDSGSRWKDLKEIFLNGMAAEKLNIYNECTTMHLKSMEDLRIHVAHHWKLKNTTDKHDDGADAYFSAVQRLLGLMYINEMTSKEDSRYLEELQMYNAQGKDINDVDKLFQYGVRFF